MSLLSSSKVNKNGDKVIQECYRILKTQTNQSISKWITDSKITSLSLRNVRAVEIVNISNYIFQKILINQTQPFNTSDINNQLLILIYEYYKTNVSKCYEYAKLVKHFSQWDYQFQYIYQVAIDQYKEHIGLYLKIRDLVLRSQYNKARKDLLSGISLQLQQWVSIARNAFKYKQEEDVIDQFTTVVKNHYVKVKKSQTEKINGAQFLKICQIMENTSMFKDKSNESIILNKKTSKSQNRSAQKIMNIFDQTLLNGLNTQDKQLIRVLSYKNKNIAQMLEQKHTKMVHLIGEQVNSLRKDINKEKEKYVEVIQEKNALIRLVQRIKQSCLKYIVSKQQAHEFQLLQSLESYNKKYNPKAVDVGKVTELINNRRLIDIIERQELENDQ